MATINASTKLKVKAPNAKVGGGTKTGGKKPGATGAGAKRGSAPPLKPVTLDKPESVEKLMAMGTDERKQNLENLFRKTLGERSAVDISSPHTSTTRTRGSAAADLAVATKSFGVGFVLKECGILKEMSKILFPQGIEALFNRGGEKKEASAPGIKPSASAVSLTSLDIDDTTATSGGSGGTDSKRGKTEPPNAREGCLLYIRALCEIVGKKAEPYVVGAFLSAALDECGSSSSAVREAAEDTSVALIDLANPWAFSTVVAPILIEAFNTTEWRVKSVVLERMTQCTKTSPTQVQKFIPTLVPVLTNQVFDTKAQVAKSAKSALLAVCDTNTNADVKPAIPAVVNAICKPAETNKAISSLMGTTFVVPVDASTLAILCPILARALKEKLAIHKRAACLVISNMSKLVEKPEAVAPFGSLLVPELKKVATNVQFEEIRDEALKALANLTKALGDLYKEKEEKEAAEMKEEEKRVEAEQDRIKAEREEEERRAEELRKKEEEEKKKFKEAMDAQRELDKIAAQEEEAKKEEIELEREKQKLSTKGASGKCQGCGLKKCKKTCMFYGM